MKKIPFHLLTLFFAIGLAACSESTASTKPSPEQTKVSETRQNSLDAAAKKISSFDKDVSAEQASIIVETMLNDGTIGLGEVLSMNFIDLSDNSDRLIAAYQTAKTAALAK
ncbi:hypothetical protein P0Y35_06960 [Kiritimatiellaeota bacterium B1221]|nr:hypothetical protein [Kiritimatiellaeota bacterium B1221]